MSFGKIKIKKRGNSKRTKAGEPFPGIRLHTESGGPSPFTETTGNTFSGSPLPSPTSSNISGSNPDYNSPLSVQSDSSSGSSINNDTTSGSHKINLDETTGNHSGEDTKVFGLPIEVAAKRSDKFGIIPAVVRKSIDFLNKKGLFSEGIYRVPGSHARAKEYILLFDKGVLCGFL
eukprot:TRINITY_DN3660_c0_g1_i1.p1 TRINITY_DN3660_c0_g1~~TRINITY_DN3660_c0_g1_i1.p1  ORF type:complete len:175 (+),score=34.72 TRINITY_DN3660_c0_g1_i1:97-621(+)